jgi:hypothetical protein
MFTLTIQCDDREELLTYAKAVDYDMCLTTFANFLRTYRKHGMPEEVKTAQDALELLRNDFYETLEAYNISL